MYVTKTPTEHEASRVGLISESTRKLDDVVARNLPMFYRRAFRYLGSMPDAEDAVQDALVSAYKHLAQFRGQAQMSTWLSAIVTNAALMQLRRRRDSHISLDQQHGEEGLALSERYPIRSQLQKKPASLLTHIAEFSKSSISSPPHYVEHFGCATLMA